VRGSYPQTQVIQWNARGIRNKLSELKQYLSNSHPTIVCITETHLHPTLTVRIPGYHIIRADRYDGFGGLAFLIPHLTVYRRNDPPPFHGVF